jgi:hypothetical protein
LANTNRGNGGWIHREHQNHVCDVYDVGVGRWLDQEKAWLEPLVGAIQIDPLKEDTMIAL